MRSEVPQFGDVVSIGSFYFRPDILPAEAFYSLGAVEEVFFQVGFDFHLPDVGQFGRKIFVEEEGVADFVVEVVDVVVEAGQNGN